MPKRFERLIGNMEAILIGAVLLVIAVPRFTLKDRVSHPYFFLRCGVLFVRPCAARLKARPPKSSVTTNRSPLLWSRVCLTSQIRAPSCRVRQPRQGRATFVGCWQASVHEPEAASEIHTADLTQVVTPTPRDARPSGRPQHMRPKIPVRQRGRGAVLTYGRADARDVRHDYVLLDGGGEAARALQLEPEPLYARGRPDWKNSPRRAFAGARRSRNAETLRRTKRYRRAQWEAGVFRSLLGRVAGESGVGATGTRAARSDKPAPAARAAASQSRACDALERRSGGKPYASLPEHRIMAA